MRPTARPTSEAPLADPHRLAHVRTGTLDRLYLRSMSRAPLRAARVRPLRPGRDALPRLELARGSRGSCLASLPGVIPLIAAAAEDERIGRILFWVLLIAVLAVAIAFSVRRYRNK